MISFPKYRPLYILQQVFVYSKITLSDNFICFSWTRFYHWKSLERGVLLNDIFSERLDFLYAVEKKPPFELEAWKWCKAREERKIRRERQETSQPVEYVMGEKKNVRARGRKTIREYAIYYVSVTESRNE